MPRVVLTRARTPSGPYKAYVESLRAAGADVIEAVEPQDIPDEFDALCLAGGRDVDPERFGQRREAETDEPDPVRDALELDEALPRAEGKPILAICRGMQVLNVYRGGTLVQHIGKTHQATGDEVILRPARIDPSSRLAEISGTAPVVNHRHHQVVDHLGRGLRATAWVDDYVEGMESTDGSWILGVQWHPERSRDGLDVRVTAIFGAFVEAARRVPAR